MTDAWNPHEAADRLYSFCEGLLKGEVRVQQEGPLSIAPNIRPRAGYAYTRRGVLK